MAHLRVPAPPETFVPGELENLLTVLAMEADIQKRSKELLALSERLVKSGKPLELITDVLDSKALTELELEGLIGLMATQRIWEIINSSADVRGTIVEWLVIQLGRGYLYSGALVLGIMLDLGDSGPIGDHAGSVRAHLEEARKHGLPLGQATLAARILSRLPVKS